MMAVIFAMNNLYRNVRADLAVRDPGVQIVFGWKQPNRQNTSTGASFARIDWVPGNEAGDMGEDKPAREINRKPRILADLDEDFHVILRGHDASAPEDEEAQYSIIRLLYDEWRASVYRAAHGTVQVGKPRWVVSKTERRLGASCVVPCIMRSPIPDDNDLSVPVSVTAILNLAIVRDVEKLEADSGAPSIDDGGNDLVDDQVGTVISLEVIP
jgi:hypothetical protein